MKVMKDVEMLIKLHNQPSINTNTEHFFPLEVNNEPIIKN